MSGMRYEKIQVNGFNTTLKEVKVDGFIQSESTWNQNVGFFGLSTIDCPVCTDFLFIFT